MSAFLKRISSMNLRRFSTAGSSSGPAVNSSSSIDRMKALRAALLLRELRQVAVAGGAQHLEAFLLDRLRERADAQARGVLGAVVLVDDDDREVEAHASRGPGQLKRASAGVITAAARRYTAPAATRRARWTGVHATWWWVAAGVLVAAELATGTFYLLMLALGAAAAALAAHAGVALQRPVAWRRRWSAAARCAAWHFKRGRQPAPAPAGANRDVNLDIGETRAGRAHGMPTATPRVQLPRRRLDRALRRQRRCRCRASTSSAPIEGNRLLLDRAATNRHRTRRNPHGSRRHRHPASSPRSSSCARSRSCRSRTPGWSSAWASTTRTLAPGLNFLMPFIDRVAYRHSLKEIPLDVPSQVCITRDNTQLQVDGILYFQVTDPMRASYGSSQLHRRDHPAGADHAAQRDRQDGARQDLRGARRRSTPRWSTRSTKRR